VTFIRIVLLKNAKTNHNLPTQNPRRKMRSFFELTRNNPSQSSIGVAPLGIESIIVKTKAVF